MSSKKEKQLVTTENKTHNLIIYFNTDLKIQEQSLLYKDFISK